MSSLTERQIRVLSKVHALQYTEHKSNLGYLSRELETGKMDLQKELAVLREMSLVNEDRVPHITSKGRRLISVVMAGGAFDIIHPGHIDTLLQAKALGDVLLVSVARDATFRRNKGREPLHNELVRQRLVSSLKMVDAAILGSEREILETAAKLAPDIIAIGYDQSHDTRLMKLNLAKRGLKVKIVRLDSSAPGIKTRKIINSERSLLGF